MDISWFASSRYGGFGSSNHVEELRLMVGRWIASRMSRIEASGIRKAFELAQGLADPIDLSIGLPDFDAPEEAKEAAIRAVREGHSRYTLTQGLPELRERLREEVRTRLGQPERELMVTSGSAGGLTLALCATVEPGDEVIIPDPYFVMYVNLVHLAGGTPIFVDTYPDFRLDPDRIQAALTPRTKCLILNSPNNPTGVVAGAEELRAIVDRCRKAGVLVLSDEVYRSFCFDGPCVSPAEFDPNVLVIDGFSKSHGMTGWRLGFAHGPAALIAEMAKLQQFTFICAPSLVQHAGLAALEADLSAHLATSKARRDRVVAALSHDYELTPPGGAFYAFPKIPSRFASATEFAAEAVRHRLLIIPGSVFSRRDTHFRLSHAVPTERLERGLEVLRCLARA